MAASQWLHYGVKEFLWVFIKHQIISNVLNFLAEILQILTYDLGSTDQTMNGSPFHVMWVVGLEVQITTCMSRFLVYFRGQFRSPLHDQNTQEWKGIISFNSIVNLMVDLTLFRVWRNLQSCWSMWPNHDSVNICEPLTGFVICCTQCYFLKVYHKYIPDHQR
jgi:hypothetical protein